MSAARFSDQPDRALIRILDVLTERGFTPLRIEIPGSLIVEMTRSPAPAAEPSEEPEEREKPEPDRRLQILVPGLAERGDAG